MDTGPVRIYSTGDTPRLRYISSLILGDMLGLPWEITTDKRKTRKRPVINYSNENIEGSFKIIPDTLLFEKGIKQREISVSIWNGLPAFFNASAESDFPFDIFAASFYLVSRYEEYFDDQQDEHGRYKASSSLAYKNGFISIPVIDFWVKEMARAFIRKFRNIAVRRNEYKALLTIDIDQAFASQGKNLFSSIGGFMEDLRRKKTSGKSRQDPYDVFEYITETIINNKAEARFFFPVGDHSRHDKNPSWKSAEYRALISEISEKFNTGLHPSYNAAFRPAMIKVEKDRFVKITGNEVIASRYHFLRFRLPDSYRQMLENGIIEDYSMGYADELGFRAGIARPFYFYDILVERQTELRVFPFQVMDETMFHYKNLGPENARAEILRIINDIRKVGGFFISIWHNTSLLDDDTGHEGRKVFEFMLKNQVYDNLS